MPLSSEALNAVDPPERPEAIGRKLSRYQR